MEAALEITGLKKTFGQDEILKGIDLTVPSGKVTVILGFSGAGKSVLLKHVLGLIKPTAGDIKILGKSILDLSEFDMNEMRKNFGMLFQHSALFDSMTVFDNVAFPLREHTDMDERTIESEVTDFLTSVGITEDKFDRFPSEISGGMQKRVALARAIALKPKIVLFDEPTTGLDPIMTNTVDQLILTTTKARKLTSLVISHDIVSTFRIADQIAFLDQGKMKLVGTPQTFLDSKDPLIQEFLQVINFKLKDKGAT